MERNLFAQEASLDDQKYYYAGGNRKAKRKAKRAKKHQAKEGKGKKLLGKAWGVFKKGNPLFVIMRSSALALIRLNLWGMATKMAKLQTLSPNTPAAKNAWISLMAHWIKFGGDKNKFTDAIKAGKVKKQLLTRKSKQISNPDAKVKKKRHKFEGFDGEVFDGGFTEEFSYPTGVEETASLIVASATVLTTIVAILQKNKGLVGDMPLTDADKAQLSQSPPAPDLTTEDVAKGAEAAGAAEAESKKNRNMTYIVIVGGVLLLGALLLLMKRKGKSKTK